MLEYSRRVLELPVALDGCGQRETDAGVARRRLNQRIAGLDPAALQWHKPPA